MESEYMTPSSQLLGDFNTYCAVVIDYKVYIGGVNVIHCYDTVSNELKESTLMPEWVLKMVRLEGFKVLCGLRNGQLVTVDLASHKILGRL